jgi:enoyl-CoA hydratase
MEYFKNLYVEKLYDERIWVVYIDRERYANSIDKNTAKELSQVFNAFDRDEKAYVAVLTGRGDKYFCAGADLSKLSKIDFEQGNTNLVQPLPHDAPLGVTRMMLNKPVIAAINGYAVAGGLELALWCDLRVSYSDCIMGVFCRRFGVPLIDGGTFRLSRVIGLSRAMDLILTGREINGLEGYTIGLINRLVSRDKVMGEAIELAKLLCSFPQECMRNDRKSLLVNSYGGSYTEVIENEYKFGKESLKFSHMGAEKFIKGEGRHGKMVSKF